MALCFIVMVVAILGSAGAFAQMLSLTDVSVSYSWIEGRNGAFIAVTSDGQVRKLTPSGKVAQELVRSASLRRIKYAAIYRDTLWCVSENADSDLVVVDLLSGTLSTTSDPFFQGVIEMRTLHGYGVMAIVRGGLIAWRRPHGTWRNLAGDIVDDAVDVILGRADQLIVLRRDGTICTWTEAEGLRFQAHIQGLVAPRRLLAVGDELVVLCGDGANTTFVVVEPNTGTVRTELPLSVRIVDVVPRDTGVICVSHSGQLIEVLVRSGRTVVCAPDVPYNLRTLVFRRLASIDGEVVAIGPYMSLARMASTGTFRLISSMADPLELGRSICTVSRDQGQGLSILCDRSRVFHANDGAFDWRTDQRSDDTISLFSAKRIQALDTTLFLLYTNNNNWPSVVKCTPGGRQLSAFHVPEPLRVFRRDTSSVEVVGRRYIGLYDEHSNDLLQYQYIGIDTLVEEVRQTDTSTYVVCGAMKRTLMHSCSTSLRSGFVAMYDRNARRIQRSYEIPEMELASDVLTVSDNRLVVLGLALNDECHLRPAIAVIGEDTVKLTVLPWWGNAKTAMRTGMGLFAGGVGATLIHSSDDGATWTRLTGWSSDSSATIEEFAVANGSLFAVGSDGARPIVLRIDTAKQIVSVVDVSPPDPGPAPIVIDAVVPNPASQEVAVTIFRDRSWPIASCALELIDMSGIVVRDFSAELQSAADDTPMSVRCPLDGLPNGQYLLSATVAGKRSTKVVVKRPKD